MAYVYGYDDEKTIRKLLNLETACFGISLKDIKFQRGVLTYGTPLFLSLHPDCEGRVLCQSICDKLIVKLTIVIYELR